MKGKAWEAVEHMSLDPNDTAGISAEGGLDQLLVALLTAFAQTDCTDRLSAQNVCTDRFYGQIAQKDCLCRLSVQIVCADRLRTQIAQTD